MDKKRVLSLILALTMVLSTVPTVFAGAMAAIGTDAKIISDIGSNSRISCKGNDQDSGSYNVSETAGLGKGSSCIQRDSQL